MTQTQVIEKQRRFLLIYAERRGITKACKTFGVSRTTFYKVKRQFLETGSLTPTPRRKPRMPNEIALSKKKILLQLVREHPAWGPQRYAEAFRRKGFHVSKVCVWHHLKRLGLNHRYQRLIYLEALNHQNQPFTEKTLRQMKRQFNEIKQGLWPGHVVALDTFYVGHLKGVGRVYQMTGIDLCSRFGWAHLYPTKEQSSTMDFVENQLLPRFYYNGVDLESVLTDHGTEFTNRQFQYMLDAYGIQHCRIPKGKPLCNGYCERFQRTILEEFYQRVFRVKFFKDLSSLQEDLDRYLVYYNFERVHFGVDSNGATPISVLKTKNSFLRHRFQKLLT